MWKADEKYSGFVCFRHTIGDLEISIKLWETGDNGALNLIYDEIIPTGINYKKNSKLHYTLSYFKWEKSTFSFIIDYKDELSEESVMIKTKIMEYEMD